MSKKAQQQDDRRLAAERDRRIQQVELNALADEQKSRDTLRRRLAEQRARAGAAGVATGGSADAILSGLTAESRAVQATRDAEDAARIDTIGETFGNRRRHNLLELGDRWLDASSRDLRAGQTSGRSLLD